jgi:hypothetical protein
MAPRAGGNAAKYAYTRQSMHSRRRRGPAGWCALAWCPHLGPAHGLTGLIAFMIGPYFVVLYDVFFTGLRGHTLAFSRGRLGCTVRAAPRSAQDFCGYFTRYLKVIESYAASFGSGRGGFRENRFPEARRAPPRGKSVSHAPSVCPTKQSLNWQSACNQRPASAALATD